jgi:midasin (ATPase involved in ribosome maturation)
MEKQKYATIKIPQELFQWLVSESKHYNVKIQSLLGVIIAEWQRDRENKVRLRKILEKMF